MDKSNENVSLPGASTEKEDPALFEVLSRNVGSREQSPVKEFKDKADSSQILEIESHLIESLSEVDNVRHSTSRSGVDIDELPPADDELAKNSQIESETSPKTVIEVEPAAPKILQSVEVQLEPHSIGVATIILDSELNEKQDSLESPALVNQIIKTNKHFETNNEKVDENFNNKVRGFEGKEGSVVIEEEVVGIKEDRKEVASKDVGDIKDTTLAVEPTNLELTKEKTPELESVTEVSLVKPVNVEVTKERTLEARIEVTEGENIEDAQLQPHKVAEQATSAVDDSLVKPVNVEVIKEKTPELESVTEDSLVKPANVEVTKEKTPELESVTEDIVVKPINVEVTKEKTPELESVTEYICEKPINVEFSELENTFILEDPQLHTVEEKPKSVIVDPKEVEEQTKSVTLDPVDTHFEPTKEESLDTEEQKKEAFPQEHLSIDINGLPLPSTPLEEEEKKKFLDSIPQLDNNSDSIAVSKKAKKEYYQSLRKYLIHEEENKPPIPLQTYRWEDLRRAKERGGYPWTHIYKNPLGPDEEPEIVLLLRKSQEFRFHSESPKSLKKVRIHDQVLVKETEKYIQELSEEEDEEHQEEDAVPEDEEHFVEPSYPSDCECVSVVSDSFLTAKKPSKLQKLKGILKRKKSTDKSHTSPDTHSVVSAPAPHSKREEGVSKKTKFMDKLKGLADRHIKRRNIKKISLKKNEQIVLGDDQKIIKLKGSPKAQRSEIPHFEKQDSEDVLEIVELDESPSRKKKDYMDGEELKQEINAIPVADEIIQLPAEEPSIPSIIESKASPKTPPKKAVRQQKIHVYEDIEGQLLDDQITEIIELAHVEALKKSLAVQDQSYVQDISSKRDIPLDRMGSSEDSEADVHRHTLAPISSIDSVSDDERKLPGTQLSPVSEEGDFLGSDHDVHSVIKREASPCPSEKKVTFSHVEDEAEPHREDIELPSEIQEVNNSSRWAKMTDHEYEPIGDPETQKIPDEKPKSTTLNLTIPAEKPIEAPKEEPTTPEEMKDVRQFQQDVEDKYFSSTATTPRSESRTDYIHTSQVDSSALEELPLKQENRTKKFMTSAQDRGRRMKAGISNQAGKIKTKIRSLKKPPRSPKGSPKAKERKRFKAPDFSKIKMPDMPDMSRFKDMKPKFSKPDMSKFKMPDKFSSLKLKRSKSMKEPSEEDEVTEQTEVTSPSKKKFEFSFGTYPRALRRTKTKEDSVEVIPPTETPSIMTTETAPSIESSPPPMGDRGPGPVRSRWADKFSDTSYIAGSDTSRLQRLESSEQESFDRESSLERRMAEALDRADKEDEEMRIISGAEEKQFADFDEENRAIHELTQFRAGELKRRTLVHQDSDLVSEESKDVGWSERDILKNRILKHAEIDTDAYMGYPSEEHLSVNTNQETQSTASSAARKLVIEEIDDDEFFIRKRGISQDNIEIRQYISSAIREGFENPENALAKVGGGDYGYDLPPRKPKRVKNFDDYDAQEDNLSLPHGNGRFYNSMPPSRPLRKGKMYSSGSQEVPNMDEPTEDMDETDRSFYDNASAPGATLAHSPPKAPKRRKRGNFRETKSMEKDAYLNGFGGRSVSNSYIEHENENQRDDMIVYRTQHNYIIPLATPERFTDGTPTPRKSRSQSHLDEDRTSRGIESLMTDNLDNELDDSIMADDSLANEKFTIEMKDGDGYAVVRKESQMPKPTPPARRKKYNNRLTDDRFATMPHLRRDNVDEDEEELPERPVRGYSTIGPPKPPRRKSLTAEDTQKSNPDISEYEELKIADDPSRRPESPRNLEDMFHKMKYRPLPPPPRPPRDRASKKSSKGYGDDDDRDGGGERLRILETIMSATESDTATEGNVVEVEVSTQTDPLPDDFVCEEFEITEDMKVIHARPRSRTVEDILREELEAEEFERVKMQLADDDTLTTGINKFRDSNQRTYSERSRGSSHLSRPQTPSAILIERRIPTPVSNGSHNSVLLEASLIVRPLEEEFLTSGDEVRSGDELKSGDELRSDEEELITTDDDLLAAEEELLAAEAELRKAEEEAMRQHMSISPLPSRFSIVPIDDEIEAIQERFNISPIETIHQDFDISPRESDVEMELHPSDYPTDERIEEMLKEIRRANEMVLEEEEKKLAVEEERRIVEEEVDNFNVEERHASPPAPQPPPRRRNSGMTPEISEVVSQITSPQDSQQPPPPPPPPSIQQAVVESTLPTRMTLSDLEVERLRVHALQAGQIMVSELQGVQVNADEFNCRSGNLVVRNIDLPPGFIEEIVERVRATERDHIQIPVETQTSPSIERLSITHSQETQTKDTEPVKEEPIKEQREPLKESPPERPPAPQTDYSYPAPPVPQNTIDYSYSVPPPSFYQLRNPDEDLPLIPPRPPYFPPPEFFQSIAPQSFYQLRNPGETDEEYEERMTRRRRHLHHHRRRDSSSGREEDEHRRHRSKSRQRHEQPQSVSQAGRELISACNASLVRRMNALASYLRNPEKSDRTMGTLTLIFILLTIGFLILAVMGHDIHHHHWDFFNLPENNGRS
ncbi:hypothetical protein ACFFRR_010711 [Megaselia abdita]